MDTSYLEKYYGKFCEEKRLASRHGQVEFTTTIKYIHDYLKDYENPQILEVGAGTGRYSCYLANEGYDVSAIELINNNLGILKAKKTSVKAYLGNAIDLSRFKDKSFDMVLLLGPMYHLISFEDKLQALKEAKRVLKDNGKIIISYCMNDYSILMYGFKENHIIECMEKGEITSDFITNSKEENLYSYVTLEDIEKLNEITGLKRIKIIAQDGPTDYMRNIINKMDEKTFETFIKYHLSRCERQDLLGASSHTLDILEK